MKIDGLLNKNDIVQLLDGTPEGFQYLNDAGWRHNDLKENNVMVKKCNRQKHPVAVIIDFGKSRRINDLKRYRSVKCNPEPRHRWIALEIHDGTGRQTVRSDIFSLGD